MMFAVWLRKYLLQRHSEPFLGTLICQVMARVIIEMNASPPDTYIKCLKLILCVKNHKILEVIN